MPFNRLLILIDFILVHILIRKVCSAVFEKENLSIDIIHLASHLFCLVVVVNYNVKLASTPIILLGQKKFVKRVGSIFFMYITLSFFSFLEFDREATHKIILHFTSQSNIILYNSFLTNIEIIFEKEVSKKIFTLSYF